MSNENERLHLEEMFIARTHCRRLVADATDRATGSRFGGAPPANLAAEPPTCPRCGGDLQYVLTLAEDTVPRTISQGKAVSLLCCRSWDCLREGHEIVDSSPVVLLTHEDQPRATKRTPLDSSAGFGLITQPLTPEKPTDNTKLGGEPGYIQNWGPEEGEKALSAGRGFLFQYSETKGGDDPFLGGVVYVFSRVDPVTGLPTLSDFAAFWQCT